MATVASDPRFQLARDILSCGGGGTAGAQRATDIFAQLHDSCSAVHGEGSLNAALCQYERGNALFRGVVRRRALQGDGGDDDGDKKPAARNPSDVRRREAMATAALKRATPTGDINPPSGKRAKKGDNEADEAAESNASEEEVDLDLAMSMMESSCVTLLSHAFEDGSSTEEQKQWAKEQLPRVLVCIGDLHLYRGECGNAVDAYCQALPYREEAWDKLKQTIDNDRLNTMTAEGLRCQRLLAETQALVAEALLESPEGEDVVCHSEDGENDPKGEEARKAAPRVLVPATERISFAHSHYVLAKKASLEIFFRLGNMVTAKIDVGDEQESLRTLGEMLKGLKDLLGAEE